MKRSGKLESMPRPARVRTSRTHLAKALKKAAELGCRRGLEVHPALRPAWELGSLPEGAAKAAGVESFVDGFCGIGAGHTAAASHGIRCVAAYEIDDRARMAYLANHGIIPHGDITKVVDADIPQHDLLVAGFPCTDYSRAGRLAGEETERGRLFNQVIRFARLGRPRIMLLENVPQFATLNEGRAMKSLLAGLGDLGYSIFHRVLDAADFGLPAVRERLFILAFRNDLGVTGFKFPDAPGIRVCFGDIAERGEAHLARQVIHRMNPKVDMAVEAKAIAEHGERSPRPITLGGYPPHKFGFRIASHQGPNHTLVAYGGGLGQGSCLVRMEDGTIRRTTRRERARMQGFPETFRILFGDGDAFPQFGNAFPVPIARLLIAEAVKAILAAQVGAGEKQ